MFIRNSLLILTLSLGIAQANSLNHPLSLTTPLSFIQEVGPIDPSTPKTAEGQGTFIYDKSTHMLTYKINFAGLSGAPTMAHFHLAPRKTNGPVIQMICGAGMAAACPSESSGQVQGTWQVPNQYVKALLSGGVFVNFHTKLNPAGEIRGQLSLN